MSINYLCCIIRSPSGAGGGGGGRGGGGGHGRGGGGRRGRGGGPEVVREVQEEVEAMMARNRKVK